MYLHDIGIKCAPFSRENSSCQCKEYKGFSRIINCFTNTSLLQKPPLQNTGHAAISRETSEICRILMFFRQKCFNFLLLFVCQDIKKLMEKTAPYSNMSFSRTTKFFQFLSEIRLFRSKYGLLLISPSF